MPTYDFQCQGCGLVFEVFRPMSEASEPALCPDDQEQAVRLFGVAEAYVRDRAPVRKAQIRLGDYQKRPGTIVDHIVTGDGMARQRQTEKELLQAAAENGVRPSQGTIVLKGDPPRRRARGLISFPGRPARTKTRDEAGY